MKIANAAMLTMLLTLGLIAGCSDNPSQDTQQGMNASGTATQQAPAPATQQPPAPTTHQQTPTSI